MSSKLPYKGIPVLCLERTYSTLNYAFCRLYEPAEPLKKTKRVIHSSSCTLVCNDISEGDISENESLEYRSHL